MYELPTFHFSTLRAVIGNRTCWGDSQRLISNFIQIKGTITWAHSFCLYFCVSMRYTIITNYSAMEAAGNTSDPWILLMTCFSWPLLTQSQKGRCRWDYEKWVLVSVLIVLEMYSVFAIFCHQNIYSLFLQERNAIWKQCTLIYLNNKRN